MAQITIGDRLLGDGQPAFVIAEIGINHNGDVGLANKMINAAAWAGCDAVKFQKRTLGIVYRDAELARPRISPFGETNGDLKRALELDTEDFAKIDLHCVEQDMMWFASCWDEESIDFIDRFNPPAYKIASASLTDLSLIDHTCECGKPIILSTGMSTLEEIDRAVDVVDRNGNALAILHCVSTYPAKTADLNLKCIQTLRNRYHVPIGYSGHEIGLATSVAAVAMGASIIERHITLDRSSFGSDQAASIEPQGVSRLVRDIRTIEAAMGDGVKVVLKDERPLIEKLRRVVTA